jgi:oligosaccharide repeat unit polymerase
MIILLIVLVYATITVAKAVFVDYFIFSLVTLYLKKQVRLKHLVVVGGILLGVFFLLQFLREGIDFSNVSDRYNFIILYLNSSMSAFDVLEPMSSAHIGENIFRFLYHIFNKLNLSSIEPIEPLLPFISKPIVTNTYTIMYPFYKDFGSVAILIGAIFYGCLYGFFYKRYTTNQNNVWYLVSYIFMFKMLFYQHAAESLLTNLYPAMLTLFLLYFPFWYSKYVPLKIKKECCT